MLHLRRQFTAGGPQRRDPVLGFDHAGQQRFESFLQIHLRGPFDLLGDFLDADVADRRTDLVVQLFQLFVQLEQLRLQVHHLVKLLLGGDSAFGPQRSALAVAPLDRGGVIALNPFQFGVLVLQFASAFDPMLLPRHLVGQMLQLLQRSQPAFGLRLGRIVLDGLPPPLSTPILAFVVLRCDVVMNRFHRSVRRRHLGLDLDRFLVQRIDPAGDHAAFLLPLLAFPLQIIDSFLARP